MIQIAKRKPKVNDTLYLKRNNLPLDLKVGDKYGTIKEITEDKYIVERFDGKIMEYSFSNKEDVFKKWFDWKSK